MIPGKVSGASVIATRRGESIPVRFPSSSLWSVGNLIGVEMAHLAFHRLQARRSGAEEIQSNVTVLPVPVGGDGARASASSRLRIRAGKASRHPSTVFLKEYAAFVGLRNILLGAGWSRVVKTPSPFVSTAGGSLASVLNAGDAEARLRSFDGGAWGPFGLASEFLWVKHPDSRLWREVKNALSSLQDTVHSILSDGSVWETEESAAGAISEFTEAFNSAVRTLNQGVDSFKGLLPNDPLLQGAEAAVVESVRGPVQGLPDQTDEAAEAGLEFDRRGAVALSGLQLSAAVPQDGTTPSGLRTFLVSSALEKIGVTLAGDYTLKFDREAFSAAYRRDPGTVRDLFAGAPKPGEYDDGLPLFRRLAKVLDTLMQPETGSFRMTEEQAEALKQSRPWEAYMKASADIRRQTLSLLV